MLPQDAGNVHFASCSEVARSICPYCGRMRSTGLQRDERVINIDARKRERHSVEARIRVTTDADEAARQELPSSST
jgi:hypothetical protein